MRSTKAKKAIRLWKAAASVTARRAPEWSLWAIFLTLTLGSLILPFWLRAFATPQYSAALNAALSIGTGGLTSLVFYYVMTERLERRHRRLLRTDVRDTYAEAKRNIAYAIVHASQKGGRRDLFADSDTIDRALTVQGFREMFQHGREGDEGFYAFENQMSDRTPEFDEIVFNLKVVSRALDRIVDSHRLSDPQTYSFFVRISSAIARIEKNGPGYDESKPLCSLIWQVFAGWNFVDGKLDYDPIERAIERI